MQIKKNCKEMPFYDYFQEYYQNTYFNFHITVFISQQINNTLSLIAYLQTVEEASLSAQQNCMFLNAEFKTSYTLLQ